MAVEAANIIPICSFSEKEKACFLAKTSLFHPFGGDKRDRTADLLNAIQALSRAVRIRK